MMPASRDLETPLGRARMLFTMVSTPKLRRGVGAMLSGEGASKDPSVRGPLSRIDWLHEDGEVDLEMIRETVDALALLRSGDAILDVPPLDRLPSTTEESREVCGRIARMVFERVGVERTLTEPELNTALAMFASDVALVRRDAVDSGVLTRTVDGAQYRLAEGA